MRGILLGRRDLVDMFSSSTYNRPNYSSSYDTFDFGSLARDSVLAVWSEQDLNNVRLPSAVVVSDDEYRDLLAWIVTYVHAFRPFTAFCRVVPASVAQLFNQTGLEYFAERDSMAVGLLLGEVLESSAGSHSVTEVPNVTFLSTLSFAIWRALSITNAGVPISIVTERWTRLRDLLGVTNNRADFSRVSEMWSLIYGRENHVKRPKNVLHTFELLDRAMVEYLNSGDFYERTWLEFDSAYPGFSECRRFRVLPRETRVDIVVHLLEGLSKLDRIDKNLCGFLAAYLVSLISPGSLDHTGLLRPYVARFANSFLYYGFFAGGNLVGGSLINHSSVARRVVRDVMMPDRFLDRPRCDISLDELQLIGTQSEILRGTSRSKRIDVDLFPGVSVGLRWSGRDGLQDENADQSSQLRENLEELILSHRRMGGAIEELKKKLSGETEKEPVKSRARKRV